MSEHLSEQNLERYRRRMMQPAELLTANDHVATCEACYQRFSAEDLVATIYTFVRANLKESDREEYHHFVYEQMAAYADDALSEEERTLVQSHMEVCQECETEVGDLLALKASINSDRKLAPKTSLPLFSRFTAFWQAPAYRLAFQIAGAVAMSALVYWAATMPLRTRLADLQSQLTSLRQENERLQQDDGTAGTIISDLQTQLEQSRRSEIDQSPNPSQQIVLTLNDGDGQVTLDKRGNLTGLRSLQPEHLRLITTALTTERIKTPPVLAELLPKPGTLMGNAEGSGSFALLSPVGTVVLSDRPTMRWHSLSGATGYIVIVVDSNSNEVAASQLLSATEWRVPRPLERNRIYFWQVRALKGGAEIRMPAPAAPDAKFKVLEQAKTDELERAKPTYANSRLMSGILYAEVGLLDDAEREFQALARANPKSGLAQKLLRNLKARRH
jgi:putative zinc finger protein